MLRTKPIEARFSIACQVVSRDIVVSISSTPSSPMALEVVPTPACPSNSVPSMDENGTRNSKDESYYPTRTGLNLKISFQSYLIKGHLEKVISLIASS